jgi:hypothetical protein
VQDLEKASLHPYLMEWKGDMTQFRKIYAEVVELLKYDFSSLLSMYAVCPSPTSGDYFL